MKKTRNIINNVREATPHLVNALNCVINIRTWSKMKEKELYTKKEYFKLFDDMDAKIIQLKSEKEQSERELVKKHKANSIKLAEENKKLRDLLKYEREKNSILQKKIMDITDDFLKLSKEAYGNL